MQSSQGGTSEKNFFKSECLEKEKGIKISNTQSTKGLCFGKNKQGSFLVLWFYHVQCTLTVKVQQAK